MNTEALKQRAAERALDYVGPGMRLGLGTGSTAAMFVELLGARVRDGLDVICIPTSDATRTQAEGLGIPLATFGELPGLDLTVDGTDEFDDQLRLIKGGGGALLREKIVAAASECMVVIADQSKHVQTLGAFALPVEVVKFGWQATLQKITRSAASHDCAGAIALRGTSAKPFVTDGGNYVLDCAFGRIADPEGLDSSLSAIPGVVEHGLFIGMARSIIVAGEGGIQILGEQP